MPCQVCKEKFMHNPCQETTIQLVELKSLFDRNLYENFKEKCPCKECLVKIVCYDVRMECFDYASFLRNRGSLNSEISNRRQKQK